MLDLSPINYMTANQYTSQIDKFDNKYYYAANY
jgi:hypothetical protein